MPLLLVAVALLAIVIASLTGPSAARHRENHGNGRRQDG
jgi:hypothetical protein